MHLQKKLQAVQAKSNAIADNDGTLRTKQQEINRLYSRAFKQVNKKGQKRELKVSQWLSFLFLAFCSGVTLLLLATLGHMRGAVR